MVALAVLLGASTVAWGQAFRPPPMPRLPGGGSHFFHLPIHWGDIGMYALVVIAGIAVIAVGWSLGYVGGRWSAGKPVFAPLPTGSASAPVFPVTSSPAPDRVFAPEQTADKSARTTRLMERLAQTERAFDPGPLRDWIWGFFHEVQRCWQERDSGPVRERMTPAARAAYEGGIADLRWRSMVNKLDSLSLLRLHFVHVARPAEIAGHSVTALLTFQAQSRYVHERTGTLAGGSWELRTFQESWTFRRDGDRWLLHEVKPSRDSTLLTKPNEVAGFTKTELRSAELGVIVL
jgi:predicted lipid-binding transport protein (Tim44 family)